MSYYNTILSQVAALIPRHDFEYHAKIHHIGQKFRKCNRWNPREIAPRFIHRRRDRARISLCHQRFSPEGQNGGSLIQRKAAD